MSVRVRRAPDNVLFDHACELVEATVAIRRAIADPDAVDAAPALLGCVEAALRDLVSVAERLGEIAAEAEAPEKHRARAARGVENLRVALDDAAVAAAVARALTARATHRLR